MDGDEQAKSGGRPTATVRQMISLPDVPITTKQVNDGAQCGVCISEFVHEETVDQLPCQHYFHKDCILPWRRANPTCPMCRAALKDQYVDYEHASSTAQQSNRMAAMVLIC